MIPLAVIDTEEAADLIDHAAQAGDRWLAIVMFSLFVITVWTLWRYFQKELAKRDTRIDELARKYDSARDEWMDFLRTTNREMVTILQRNNELIADRLVEAQQTRKVLLEVEDALERTKG